MSSRKGLSTRELNDADKKKDEEISSLETELEKVNLELITVRKERDKQRQELASLTDEHTQLSHQKEQRLKRNQISSQLKDLEKSVNRKMLRQQLAMEDLEQAKSRHRQLKKTVDLLQGGVQAILSKSYYYDQKDDTTEEGNLRIQKRQTLLKGLLTEELKMKLLTSSLSNLNVGIHSPFQNGKSYDEDDEINDGAEGVASILLFADKNKRGDSVSTELSVDDYSKSFLVPSIATAAASPDKHHSGRSLPRKSQSKDRSKSGRRSPSNDSTSRRNRSSSRDRSTRSSTSQGKSQSRRGRRPTSSRHQNEEVVLKEEEHDTINYSSSTSKMSGLASMLETSKSKNDSDDESDDTPKTANTNG